MEGLLKVFENQVISNKSKVAIVCGGQELSYGDLYFQAYNLSIFFKKEGLKPNDNVIIRSEPTPYYWVIYFATVLSDGVFVSLDKNVPDETFASIINELGGCFVYIDNEKNRMCDFKFLSYEEVINQAKAKCYQGSYDLYKDIESDKLTQIIYTTGTTGKAKGVKWPYSYQFEAAFDCDVLPYNEKTIIAIVAPLDHTLANIRAMTTFLYGGTVLQFSGLSNLEDFYDDLNKYKVNSFAMAPSAIKYLSTISFDYLESVCKNALFFELGGEKMPKKNQEELLKIATKARTFIGYAATECGTVGFYEFSKYGPTENRVRKITEGSEICLFNDKGEAIGTPKNVTGYIGVKKNFKFLGYHDSSINNPIIKDNFIVLSDFGHIDDEEFLCLDGRDGETIISGGYKINPVEVENVCLKYDGVDDCVCYGITNEVFGKIVALDVVGKNLNKNDLNSYLIKHLEINKMPKVINLVDKVERNKMGKIDRRFYRR